LYNYVYKDLKAADSLKVKKIGQYDSVPNGYYRVCLVLAFGTDYHWYRQNPDGTWSHKPGATEVTKLDSSASTIYNPATADRGNYTTVVGFYAIKKK